MWSKDKNAVFDTPKLYTPSSVVSDSRFANKWLEISLDYWSIASLMDDIFTYNIGSDFKFMWTVTLTSNKTCSDPFSQTNSIILDKNNYKTWMKNNNIDVLLETPYVSESNGFYPYEHKHEMLFQIFDVKNEYDGQFGTMTWKFSWDGPTISNLDEWIFFFPKEGIAGTYTPEKLSGMYIYKKGHYQLYK